MSNSGASTEAQTVLRIAVDVSADRKTIAVFTFSIISGELITHALTRVANEIVGARVFAAEQVMLPENEGNHTRYTLGTAGRIQFPGPQDEGVLRRVQKAVIDALIDEGFGTYD